MGTDGVDRYLVIYREHVLDSVRSAEDAWDLRDIFATLNPDEDSLYRVERITI